MDYNLLFKKGKSLGCLLTEKDTTSVEESMTFESAYIPEL